MWASTQRRPLSGICLSTSSNRSSMPSPAAPPIVATRMSFLAHCSSSVLELIARQAGVGVEARPAGVGRGCAAHVRRRALRPAGAEQPADLEPVVARGPARRASRPRLRSASSRGAPPAAFQFGLIASVARMVERAAAMHLLVDAQQLACDAVALVDAGGAEAVVELGRLRSARAPGRRARSASRRGTRSAPRPARIRAR